MTLMNNDDDLKKYLQDEIIYSEDADTLFSSLAKLLLNKCVVRVGKKNYRLLEIEFYLYSSSHPDLITYPRTDEKGGSWFFHQSGVDICFKSPDDGSNRFGGILIRSMVQIDSDMKCNSAPKPIHGPMKCMDTLFKSFGALDCNRHENQIPYIDLCSSLKEEKVMKTQRYIPIKNTAEEKIKSILHYTYNDDLEGVDIAAAAEFIKKDTSYRYRYYIEPKIKYLWKDYQAKPKNGISVS